MENDLPNKRSGAQGEPVVESVDVGPKDGFTDKESDLHFEIAIGRNKSRLGLERRDAVEMVWRDMAQGKADQYDRDEWLTYIAQRLVAEIIDNNDLDEKLKGPAALFAVGLEGRRVVNSRLLNDLDTLMCFGDLMIPDRKISLADKEQLLRQQGHFKGMSVQQAKKQIQNISRKLG